MTGTENKITPSPSGDFGNTVGACAAECLHLQRMRSRRTGRHQATAFGQPSMAGTVSAACGKRRADRHVLPARGGERASYRRWKARLDEQASTAATKSPRGGRAEAGRSDGGAVCRSGALGTMPTAAGRLEVRLDLGGGARRPGPPAQSAAGADQAADATTARLATRPMVDYKI